MDFKSIVRRSESAVSPFEFNVTEPKMTVNDAKSVVSPFKFTINPVEGLARWIKSCVSELAEHVIRIQSAVTELEVTVICALGTGKHLKEGYQGWYMTSEFGNSS